MLPDLHIYYFTWHICPVILINSWLNKDTSSTCTLMHHNHKVHSLSWVHSWFLYTLWLYTFYGIQVYNDMLPLFWYHERIFLPKIPLCSTYSILATHDLFILSKGKENIKNITHTWNHIVCSLFTWVSFT